MRTTTSPFRICHLCGSFLVALLLFILAPLDLQAQDSESPYRVFGTARTNVGVSSPLRDVDYNDDLMAWTASLEAHHRYSLEGLEARVDHLVSYDGEEVNLDIWEAYLQSRPAPWMDLSIGKKRLSFGMGGLFTASDWLHPRESPGNEKSGFVGTIVRVSLGQEWAVAAAANLDKVLDQARETPVVRGLDGIAGAGVVDWQTGPFNLGAAIQARADDFVVPILWSSYDVGGLILAAEGSVDLEDDFPLPVWTARIRWLGSAGDIDLDLSADGLYYGPGDGSTGPAVTRPWRDYWYLGLKSTVSVTDTGSLAGLALVNLMDHSWRLLTTLTIQTADSLDLELGAHWAFGDAEDEFALLAAKPGSPECAINAALVLQW